jgi:Cu+-exporting ATPase
MERVNMPVEEKNATLLAIEGMSCSACVLRVQDALQKVPGVTACAVDLASGMARVEAVTAPDQAVLVSAVRNAGYKAQTLGQDAALAIRTVQAQGQAETNAMRWRLILALVLGTPVLGAHIRMMLDHIHHPSYEFLWAELILSTLVVWVAGWPYIMRAARGLWHGAWGMDLLISLGAVTAWAVSLSGSYQGLRGLPGGMIEYHAAVAIIMFISVGKYIETRLRTRTGGILAALAQRTAVTATVADSTDETPPSEGWHEVPADQVTVGQWVRVNAQQVVPVDGMVVTGTGSLDAAVVTGESVPVELSPGTGVPAGSLLIDGSIVMHATATAGNSVVARMLQYVQAAQLSKSAMGALTERLARWFVPVMILIALGALLGWWWAGAGWVRAFEIALSTVVIACPCALGLAAPAALAAGIGRASRAGILFTRASALEAAHAIHTLYFDKTGTLTTGHLRVVEVLPYNVKEDRVLLVAGALEQFAQHPIAAAILQECQWRGLKPDYPDAFSSTPGGGVRGALAGAEAWVGRPQFVPAGTPAQMQDVQRLQEQGCTVVAVVTGTQWQGLLALRDELRPEAEATVQSLQADGVVVGVLSGDHARAVAGTTKALQLTDVQGELSPTGKAEHIAQVQAKHPGVAFVGDGINDAPALAAADLGIALASGSQLARSAGDVILLSGQLTHVAVALRIARRTMRVMRQNLFWAFFYNVLAVPLAVAGVLPPAVSAAAMALSSLTVVLNALRLHWIKV